ncbi:anti-sigma B factor antagonist [Lachnospiraceae bacterium XBB2008]|nr:STAS domain-containing protein [Lachnospiraceae bacterium]SCY60363.1 anti-sigma B factor antagonist [Lachnospiraceae bacterium XBB2008]
MTIEEIKGENTVQLNVEGRIDAMTANDFQNAILKAFQKSSNVIIDMRNVQYISSAGLRGLMIGHKTASSKGGKFTLINVGEAVNEVLRVTGLDKALNIQ